MCVAACDFLRFREPQTLGSLVKTLFQTRPTKNEGFTSIGHSSSLLYERAIRQGLRPSHHIAPAGYHSKRWGPQPTASAGSLSFSSTSITVEAGGGYRLAGLSSSSVATLLTAELYSLANPGVGLRGGDQKLRHIGASDGAGDRRDLGLRDKAATGRPVHKAAGTGDDPP